MMTIGDRIVITIIGTISHAPYLFATLDGDSREIASERWYYSKSCI